MAYPLPFGSGSVYSGVPSRHTAETDCVVLHPPYALSIAQNKRASTCVEALL